MRPIAYRRRINRRIPFGQSKWSDKAALAAVRAHILPIIKQPERFRAQVVDDTAMPKTGQHPLDLTREYCCQRCNQDNG